VGFLKDGMSRLMQRAMYNPDFVKDDSFNSSTQNVFRDPQLEIYDAYFENRQYANLPGWNTAAAVAGRPVNMRERAPLIKPPFARGLSSLVASKLIGPTVFPKISIPDLPDDQAYWRAILSGSQLQMFLLEPMKRMINTGAIFVRFHLVGNSIKKEWFSAKFCYPVFDESGELEEITIKYIYSDPNDIDDMGNPRRKWFRMDLGQNAETTFDNPPYVLGESDPIFTPVDTVEHNFGFVQGEWLSTTGEGDGYGLVSDIMGFIDELAYSLSASSKAVGYNQDPQVTFSGMNSDEMDNVVRSAEKSWLLGREGKAAFLESNLTGVARAMELRDKITQNLSLLSRVVLLDPEKIVGSAQSAKAMEVLHGPLKDMVDELRLPVTTGLERLILKMGAANFLSFEGGGPFIIAIPQGFVLQQLSFDLKWPEIFQHTLEDTSNKVGYTTKALAGGIIGPRTAVMHIADDFNIEDIDQELADIQAHAQAVAALNPFNGGF
jgi:hypothetical protein